MVSSFLRIPHVQIEKQNIQYKKSVQEMKVGSLWLYKDKDHYAQEAIEELQ